MSLRKIKEPEKICLSPEHNPPSHYVYEAGTWEYVCPACGKKQVFDVPQVTC